MERTQISLNKKLNHNLNVKAAAVDSSKQTLLRLITQIPNQELRDLLKKHNEVNTPGGTEVDQPHI